ncbi:cold-shock protein [Serratia sp. DD3]|uniref:cold-shock protein n=1 Tax=Serratia sp. DD3 TaxID=1410619 RepID=UPI0003C4E102|nr:cold shock domain-containing protein [Serratia sp. DD3]KEY57352.1 cold shock-like protein CspB [Serratia sp. DD3]
MFKNSGLKMGRVKWFDQAEGYGFISPVDGSDEIYVSRRAIANTNKKSLNEGQNVEFSIYRSSHGLTAADVIAF